MKLQKKFYGNTTGYFATGVYDISGILKDYKKLETDIEQYKEPIYRSKIDDIDRNAVYYSTRSNLEIAIDFELPVGPNDYDNLTGRDVSDERLRDLANKYDHNVVNLLDDIEEYLAYKSVYDTFRNGKRFNCNDVRYDNGNGRINQMDFTEI